MKQERVVLLSLSAAAIGIVFYRAICQSVTIDEAGSFLIFVNHPWPFPLYPGSGNHLLNSILQWVVMAMFGISTVTLRAPAVAGGILYILSAAWMCTLLTRRVLLQALLFVCLVYNPMILDYLVAARGYSLAMAFLLAALTVIASVTVARDAAERAAVGAKAVAVSVLLSLSFASNFAFAYVAGATGILFLMWAAAQRPRTFQTVSRLAFQCFSPGIIVCGVICGWTLLRYPRSELYFGSQSLIEMWSGLAAASFDISNSEIVGPWLSSILTLIEPVLPILCLVSLVLLFLAAESDSRARQRLTFMRFVTGVAAITLVAHWTMFTTLHIPLPKDRTGLFLVLLATLLFGSALAIAFESSAWSVIRRFGISVLLVVAVFFVGCLRFGYFTAWKFDADTKYLYGLTKTVYEQCGVTNVVLDWTYGNALNFYRVAESHGSTAEFLGFDKAGSSTGRLAYMLDYGMNADFIKEHQLEVIYHGKVSNATVAVSGCAGIVK